MDARRILACVFEKGRYIANACEGMDRQRGVVWRVSPRGCVVRGTAVDGGRSDGQIGRCDEACYTKKKATQG